jgi:hypothetical protein
VENLKPTRSIVPVIARLSRDLIGSAPDRPDADLAEDVKQLCARYHVPYDSDAVAKAIRCERWKARHLRGRL